MKYLMLILFFTSTLYSQNMEQHQWKNRVIILYAEDQYQDLLEQQFNVLNDNPILLVERKLVIYKCNQESCLFYDLSNDVQVLPKLEMKQKEFQFTLIGLDGSVKLSSQELVTKDQLFALIDSMPMRKQEIKQKQKGND